MNSIKNIPIGILGKIYINCGVREKRAIYKEKQSA